MPIQFVPARRTMLLCDYSLGGFQQPEMIKRRPALVVSPRLRQRNDLCAVVPLSTTGPTHNVPYVVQLTLQHALPYPFSALTVWAKCDMLATVGLKRLDFFRTGRKPSGKRQFLQPKLDQSQFDLVAQAVLHGLGLGHLTARRPSSNW